MATAMELRASLIAELELKSSRIRHSATELSSVAPDVNSTSLPIERHRHLSDLAFSKPSQHSRGAMFRFFSKRSNQRAETRASIPTVKFDPKQVTKAIRADLSARISEFEDLPEGKQAQIFDAAVIMAQRGGNLHHLATTLIDLGVPKGRANYITRYLASRSRALMNVARMRDNGLTEGKWLYSGAPCYATNAPSIAELAMDEAHRSANGRKFPLDKGVKLNGVWTFPSLEPGCKCVTIAVVPGF